MDRSNVYLPILNHLPAEYRHRHRDGPRPDLRMWRPDDRQIHHSDQKPEHSFSKLKLKKDKQSDVFLGESLKITRTSFKEDFKFFGRTAHPIEFDEVAEFLQTEKSMVKKFF